jgi:hypothetical protein
MTNNLSEDDIGAIIEKEKPDIVGATAITPSIYKAERLLQIAKEAHPGTVTVLGGIHATFMYQQVLTEAPWIDAIVRGEGEAIFLNLVRSVDKGVAYSEDGEITATPSEPSISNLDGIRLEWEKYIYIPTTGARVAIPNLARGCPFTYSFCSQWKPSSAYLKSSSAATLPSGKFLARGPADLLAPSKSHGKNEAAAAAHSVSSQGKNNHDTWDCQIFLRTCSALHELPHGPTFLGGGGCEAV